MGKPLPMELRRRVVDFVEEGHTHRAAAAHFRVSIKFVNDMVILKRTTGTLRRIREKCCLTLDELVVELREVQGVKAHRVPVWRHLRGLGLTHKKRPAGRPAEAA